jgi:NADH dehydrogenase
MKDQLVTVFGGDGFVGRYVVQALLRRGARVRVASRKPKAGWFLKAQANLGQLTRVAADVTRPDTVAAAVAGADAVVNLVAIMGGDLSGVNVRGAANVAAAARDAGVRALVHISAIGADSDGAAAYARSKGDAEAAVRAAFPGAAILRPSIVFGREDAFINRFAGLIRMLPIMPVIGAETKFQPVFVGDVARAVAACVGGAGAGQTLELGGPQVLTMLQLNEWIATASGRSKFFAPVPMPIAGIMATLTGWLPGAPITRDQWVMLQKDNVVSEGKDGLAAMNITPTPLDAAARGWMVQYRKHGRFGAVA